MLFLAGAVVMALAGRVPTWLLLVGVAVAGTGYAGQQLFPLAMLPDTIQADALRTGPLRSGSSPACGRRGRPSASRSGPFLFAMVLALGGFVATTSGHDRRAAAERPHGDRPGLRRACRRC